MHPDTKIKPATDEPLSTPVRVPSKSIAMPRLWPREDRGTPSRQKSQIDLADAEILPVGRPQAGLDKSTSERIRRGNREPDARIDLHGMSVERAHRACLVFLSDALSRGCRMVLVITGKGGHDRGGIMRDGRGVLRASLPGWLRASPLRNSIVGIYQAHRRHGGEGAVYVYLKRRR